VSGPTPHRNSRQALLVRVLAIPFVPIVAAWELLKAAVRGLGTALLWLGRALWYLAGLPFRAVAALLRFLVAFLKAVGRFLLPILSAVGNGFQRLALLLAEAILPVLVRAGLIVRELVRELVIAVRALGVRILIPLRLLANGVIALLRRAALILRLVARSIWLALAALWVRILVPLRLALRALTLLAVRTVLLVTAAGRAVVSAAEAVGRAVWKWLLAPIGRAVTAAFRVARWLVVGLADLVVDVVLVPIGRGVSAVLRAARWLAVQVGRLVLTWVLLPIGRGVSALVRAARWIVRSTSAVLRAAGLLVLLLLIPIGQAAWRMASAIAATARAAARLAWRPVGAVLSIVGAALDAAMGTVRGAVRSAATAVAEAVHSARVGVAEAIHDSRDLVRRAFGRPPLPAFVWREPPPRVAAVEAPKPAVGRRQRRPTVGGRGRLVAAGALGIMLTLVGIGFMNGRPTAAPSDRPASETPGSTRESASAHSGPILDPEGCSLLQPGTPISAPADAACGTLAGAVPVAALDCATATDLPPTLRLEGWDGSVLAATFFGSLPDPGIAYVNHSCRLAVPAGQAASLTTGKAAGDNVVVIADYVPPAHATFDVGVDGRCTRGTQCVHALVTDSGQALIGEHLSTGAWQHQAGPQVVSGTGENRMVLWLRGGMASAWLNGRETGPLAVSSQNGPGQAGFFFLNQDEVPLQVDLRQLAILSLSS